MDLGINLVEASFVGLMTVGFVNVISFYYPNLDSKKKFGLSVGVAFALTFVPAELGNIILEKAKVALEVAVGASGFYKLMQKAGGE